MNKRDGKVGRGGVRKGTKGGVLAIAILLGYLTGSLADTANTVPELCERDMIVSLTAGDYPRTYACLEKMLTAHPDHPLSFIHYGRLVEMGAIFGPEAVEALAVKVKGVIKSRNGPNAPACLLALDCARERLAYGYDPEKARHITNGLKPVREWALIGPFNRYGTGDMEYRFMPELTSEGGGREREKRIIVEEHDGILRPGRFIRPGGVAYARASFIVGGAVKVRVYCRSDYRLIINGRTAGGNEPDRRRNMRIFDVREARRITLLIKMRVVDGDEGVRVLVTDDGDAVISPSIDSEASFWDECDVSEGEDFSHAHFMGIVRRDPAYAYARLGIRLDGLESGEAAAYYRKSLAAKEDDFVSYLLGASLIAGDGAAADTREGRRIIERLGSRIPAIAPAALKRLELLIEENDHRRALLEGTRLARSSPRFPYAHLTLLRLYDRMGYDREFNERALEFKKIFPKSHLIMEAEAGHYRVRDRDKYLETCLALAKRAYTPRRGRIAAGELISRGDYVGARTLTERLNFNNDLIKERVAVSIKSGDFPTARKIIFSAILQMEDPWFYEALARMDMMDRDDPSMYLQKLLSIDPSRFEVSDYLRYLDGGGVAAPEGMFMDEGGSAAAFRPATSDGRHPSTILYRARTFFLQNDGSSRAFCEDIIHLADEKGISRHGEIRIPCRGRFIPVRMRVHDEKGGFADSYAIRKENDAVLLTIPSLGRDSIVHIAYVLDNAVFTPGGGRLFSFAPEYLQGYNEPVETASIKVITPMDMTVDFHFRDTVPVESSVSDGLRHYSVRMKGLPAVRRERDSGGPGYALAYYSFSTMRGFEDFVSYRGGFSGEGDEGTEKKGLELKKEGLEGTIAAVYNFTAREIDLDDGGSGWPVSPGTILIERRGTAEEKALLARALLQSLGIRSYLAFGRDRLQPAMNGYMFHEYFTDCLLFVPLDRENALWLDFSSREYACGTVSGRIDGADASVMINGSGHTRRVRSRKGPEVRGEYRLRVGDDGGVQCAAEVSFDGSKAEVRSLFRDSHRGEEAAHRHMEKVLAGFVMDGFRTRNIDECGMPLVMEAEGTGSGAVIEGGRLVFRPVARGSALHGYVSYPSRSTPLVIDSGVDEFDRYTWILPESFRGVELTRSETVRKRFGSVSIVLRKKKGSAALEVTKSVLIPAAVIRADEYPDFLDFCRALQRLEGETIIME